jgi:hypothetical protein
LRVGHRWSLEAEYRFRNGFGILTSAGGAKLAWWVSEATSTRGRRAYVQIDPMGATIIAVCIILVWAHTVYGGSLRTLRALHERRGARLTLLQSSSPSLPV